MIVSASAKFVVLNLHIVLVIFLTGRRQFLPDHHSNGIALDISFLFGNILWPS